MGDPSKESNPGPRIDVDQLIHHTEFAQTPISRILDRIVKGAGDIVSWLWVVLVAVIVVNVTSRYVFGQGYIAFEELQWHLYAIGWLFGLSYAIQNDGHIRIDVLHERFKLRTKAWIDFFGILVFLIPYTMIILIYSPSFIEYSFRTNEISDAPGGLPYRWAIKSAMFFAYALVLIAALSRLKRAWATLFGAAQDNVGQE